MKAAARGGAASSPRLLSDLYYDLRDRRLLPVIALVVVAIVAVPFLLGDSEEVERARSRDRRDALAKASGSAERRDAAVVARQPRPARSEEAAQGPTPTDPVQAEIHRRRSTTNAQLGEGGEESDTTVTTTTTESESGLGQVETEDGESVTVRIEPELAAAATATNPGEAAPHLLRLPDQRPVTKQDGGASSSAQQDPSNSEGGPAADPAARPEGPGRHLHGRPPRKTPARRCCSSRTRSARSSAKPAARNKQDLCQLIEVEPGFPVTAGLRRQRSPLRRQRPQARNWSRSAIPEQDWTSPKASVSEAMALNSLVRGVFRSRLDTR